MRVTWTPSAARNLAAIRDYIATENPQAADGQIARVLSAIARLAEFPELGRAGRLLNTRELIVSRTPYIVAYRLREETVEVAGIIHGRQRWPERLP